jgi:hypothetical protein
MRRIAYSCLFAVAGCSLAPPVVKARAAHDFKCPEEQVVVNELASSQYTAKGCGKEAVYVCTNEKSEPVCVRDSEVASP